MGGPRDIKLNEVSQKEKDKYYMTSLICGILNMTQMNLSTEQKQTHRCREQTCGCQGQGGEEKMDWEFGDQQKKTIIYRMDKQQGPTLYSTGNYIQYPEINQNGKECIYV